MNSDLTKAAALLNSGAYTCVLCRGDAVFTGTERGVKPLLGWLDGGVDLNGFSAADRVVGKAAAFLYVLLGAAAVYAPVMSKAAISVLEENGIQAHCGQAVEQIINRAGTGICPMEEAVADAAKPTEALNRIRSRLIAMQNAGNSAR